MPQSPCPPSGGNLPSVPSCSWTWSSVCRKHLFLQHEDLMLIFRKEFSHKAHCLMDVAMVASSSVSLCLCENWNADGATSGSEGTTKAQVPGLRLRPRPGQCE